MEEQNMMVVNPVMKPVIPATLMQSLVSPVFSGHGTLRRLAVLCLPSSN